MSRPFRFLRRAGASLLLVALPLSCIQAAEEVATVNGEPIYREDIEQYQQQQGMGAAQAQDQMQVINELISRELIHQDALAKDLDEDPEVQAALEEARRNVLLNAAVQEALEGNPVTEKEMKSFYDEQISQIDGTEYKARHILVEEQDTAEEVVEKLESGAEFAALAEEFSTDPSGEQGGDLGWVNPQQTVPAFSEALQNLDKGEYTKDPVQSRFGWHVIELQDTRSQQPPSFEEVKPQIEQALQQRRVAEYLESLTENAEIEIKE
ncbi:peptidylprolyl isomerase [Thiohalomonas denitrificans]|uniref:peptidylprolyl isomerase n=1 Tax=Thiohalomonas denitrificans TaxID=415747 RepID=A0A1G5PJD3_9GAMM|nr:peptidylprolyl isomerase [Thiohalomonas denitrificans]SCZ49311.1 peptidyl-prolyl cis-trans isomerase C [Thiohalomonas denitrificans]